MNPCYISLFGLYQTPTLLIKCYLISQCYLCNSAVLHDQRALHLRCLQVPSHVEQRLQELERGMRSEHRGMGRERSIDQQAGVSDKLQEVMLPFTQSLSSLLAPSCSHINRAVPVHRLKCVWKKKRTIHQMTQIFRWLKYVAAASGVNSDLIHDSLKKHGPTAISL